MDEKNDHKQWGQACRPGAASAAGLVLAIAVVGSARAQTPQLLSQAQGEKWNGVPECAYLCPDGQDCSAKTNSDCVSVAGPQGGQGLVIGVACSDYGTLSARAAAFHATGQQMDFTASAAFWDYITLQGGTGLAVVSVSFQTSGSRSGATSVEADYNVAGAGTNVILTGDRDARTLSAVVSFGSAFELHGALSLMSAGSCADPTDGDADFGLQMTGFTISSTNGTPLTNVAAMGSSGTAYYGCVQPPVILTNPASICVCQGSTAAMSVAVKNPPWGPFSYQWCRNGVPIPGATDTTISGAPLVAPAVYDVVVSNSCGSVTSAPATVYLPLTARAQPTGSVTLEWCNPADILSASADLLTWQDLPTVTSPFVASSSLLPTRFFRLHCGSRLPAFLFKPASAIVSAGGSFAFSVTLIGQPPFTYQWLLDGAILPSATNATLQLSSVGQAQVGAYQLLVSNAFGSALSLPGYLALSNDSSGLALNAATASPAVSTLLVGTNNTGALSLGTSVAQPATSLLLIGGNNSGGLTANTTMGQPPVTVQRPP